jgi:hypothetical protein
MLYLAINAKSIVIFVIEYLFYITLNSIPVLCNCINMDEHYLNMEIRMTERVYVPISDSHICYFH